jgi:hypothetical protein
MKIIGIICSPSLNYNLIASDLVRAIEGYTFEHLQKVRVLERTERWDILKFSDVAKDVLGLLLDKPSDQIDMNASISNRWSFYGLEGNFTDCVYINNEKDAKDLFNTSERDSIRTINKNNKVLLNNISNGLKEKVSPFVWINATFERIDKSLKNVCLQVNTLDQAREIKAKGGTLICINTSEKILDRVIPTHITPLIYGTEEMIDINKTILLRELVTYNESRYKNFQNLTKLIKKLWIKKRHKDV